MDVFLVLCIPTDAMWASWRFESPRRPRTRDRVRLRRRRTGPWSPWGPGLVFFSFRRLRNDALSRRLLGGRVQRARDVVGLEVLERCAEIGRVVVLGEVVRRAPVCVRRIGRDRGYGRAERDLRMPRYYPDPSRGLSATARGCCRRPPHPGVRRAHASGVLHRCGSGQVTRSSGSFLAGAFGSGMRSPQQ